MLVPPFPPLYTKTECRAGVATARGSAAGGPECGTAPGARSRFATAHDTPRGRHAHPRLRRRCLVSTNPQDSTGAVSNRQILSLRTPGLTRTKLSPVRARLPIRPPYKTSATRGMRARGPGDRTCTTNKATSSTSSPTRTTATRTRPAAPSPAGWEGGAPSIKGIAIHAGLA